MLKNNVEGNKVHINFAVVVVKFLLPYLPVYNTRPCIIRIPIFDQIFHKQKFSEQKKTLILPTTDVLQW